jgi:hypothetical protein
VAKWTESATRPGEPDSSPAFRIRLETYQDAAIETAITAMPISADSGTRFSTNRRIPSQTTHPPVAAMTPASKMVPSVSTFPCPYGWLVSAGSIAFRMEKRLTADMKMSARLSKADERTPSEPERIPTTNLAQARAAALPTENQAVRIRWRSASPLSRFSTMMTLRPGGIPVAKWDAPSHHGDSGAI